MARSAAASEKGERTTKCPGPVAVAIEALWHLLEKHYGADFQLRVMGRGVILAANNIQGEDMRPTAEETNLPDPEGEETVVEPTQEETNALEAAINEDPRLNEAGVYVEDYQEFPVTLPRDLQKQCELSIRLIAGLDGFWRYGVFAKTEKLTKRIPLKWSGEKLSSLADAVQAACSCLRSQLRTHVTAHLSQHGRDGSGLVAQLQNAINDFEKSLLPDTPEPESETPPVESPPAAKEKKAKAKPAKPRKPATKKAAASESKADEVERDILAEIRDTDDYE